MVGEASIKHRPCFSFRGTARNDGHAYRSTPPRDWRIQGDSRIPFVRMQRTNTFKIFNKMLDFSLKKISNLKNLIGIWEICRSSFIRDDSNEIFKSRTPWPIATFFLQFTLILLFLLITMEINNSGFLSNFSDNFLTTFFSQVYSWKIHLILNILLKVCATWIFISRIKIRRI